MPTRVIIEAELIAFWLAWHRAGGFAELERGGWDRSTIFLKVRRFRSYTAFTPTTRASLGSPLIGGECGSATA